jgi:hypothetical protein
MPSGDDDEPGKYGSGVHIEFEESTGTLFIVDPRLRRRIRASEYAHAREEEDQSQSTSSNSSDSPLSTVEDSSM